MTSQNLNEHIDITMYLRNLKTFLESNSDASNYFYGKYSELFYRLVSVYAKENLKNNGDPALSVEQFEKVREAIFNSKIHYKDISSEIVKNSKISLN